MPSLGWDLDHRRRPAGGDQPGGLDAVAAGIQALNVDLEEC
jgi:hypothetical protein